MLGNIISSMIFPYQQPKKERRCRLNPQALDWCPGAGQSGPLAMAPFATYFPGPGHGYHADINADLIHFSRVFGDWSPGGVSAPPFPFAGGSVAPTFGPVRAPQPLLRSQSTEAWMDMEQSYYRYFHPFFCAYQQFLRDCGTKNVVNNAAAAMPPAHEMQQQILAERTDTVVHASKRVHSTGAGTFDRERKEKGNSKECKSCVRSAPSSFSKHEEVPEAYQVVVNQWREISSLALASCLLCGDSAHHYTMCRFFDGKTLCLINIADSYIYAMHHDNWMERATLRDVCSFVHMAVGIQPRNLILHIGDRILDASSCKSDSRCCDLHILPGAIVGVATRTGTTTDSTGERLVKQSCEQCEDDEYLKVSPIEKASALSASLHASERQEGLLGCNESRERENNKLAAVDEYEADRIKVSPVCSAKSPEAAPCVVDLDEGLGCPHSCEKGEATDTLTCDLTVPKEPCHGVEPCRDVALSAVEVAVTAGTPDAIPKTDVDERRRRTVHVRFIPVSMTFSDIRTLLWSCGEVHKVRLVRPKVTTNPDKMFYVCFVEYAEEGAAVKMLQMHGRRIAVSFHLGVEISKHAILGGYVTDHDMDTGKPCTFGLSDTDRWAVERHHKASGAALNDVESNREGRCTEKGNQEGCGKEGRRHRGGRKHRGRVHQLTSVAEEHTSVHNDACEKHATGPYSLQIVAREDLNRKSCDACLRPADSKRKEGVACVTKESPSNTSTARGVNAKPQLSGLPTSLQALNGVSSVAEESELLVYLRNATKSYVQGPTKRTFYEALTVLEDVRLCAFSSLCTVELIKIEVALLIHHRSAGFVDAAVTVAAGAVSCGEELTRLMGAGGSARTRAGASWGCFFTSFHPSTHDYWKHWRDLVHSVKCEGRGREEEEEDGKKSHSGGLNEDSVAAIYPQVGTMLCFVEGLLHVALLLDDLLMCELEAGGQKDFAPRVVGAGSSGASGVVWKLVRCITSLLERLRVSATECDGGEHSERAALTPRWLSTVTRVLALLPSGVEWRVGNLMDAFVPRVSNLLASTLESNTGTQLF